MKCTNSAKEKNRKKRYEPPSIQTGKIFENVMACIKLTDDAGCKLRVASS